MSYYTTRLHIDIKSLFSSPILNLRLLWYLLAGVLLFFDASKNSVL